MKKWILLAASVFFAVAVLWKLNINEEAMTEPESETAPAVETPKPVIDETVQWWMRELESGAANGSFELAADYADRLAAYYRQTNDPAKAQLYEAQREQYWQQVPDVTKRLVPTYSFASEQVTITPYVSVPAPANPHPAKFEPETGVYLGMYAADKRAGFNNIAGVETVYGRKHALYLTYTGWRKVQTDTNTYFPLRFADRVAAVGGAIQIGWEPRFGLDDVKDDEYVRTFAKEAAAWGKPVFLRYASEMNGNWVPWYGDPRKYVEKFRLIHDIMAQEAPNVVMVWSPNFSPYNNIEPYYPGDDYVDWIGYSLYASVPTYDNKEDFDSTIIDSFKRLYDMFPNKPIMISESGVSHFDMTLNKGYERWAEGQVGSLYELLPRLFPRIKSITYFNYSKASSTRSNKRDVYDLGENPFADSVYRHAIANPMFLSEVKNGASSPAGNIFVPLGSAKDLQGKHELFTYVKLPHGEQPFAVSVAQNGHTLGTAYAMPWLLNIDFSRIDPLAPITLTAFDRSMTAIATTNAFLPH
ncbi:glycoside hydrolase family 26 protein [Paenibacillus cymbidii]|uniref:glycoside hydrolase family 26 protein n=1 Tax=Paenibacillus cymbidii TaxID=1639034 RepID=UPI001080C1D9|nr:glycosyl hydrolase [Paenibacillus cymbidii]